MMMNLLFYQIEKQFNTCVGRCRDDALKYHLRGIVVGKEKSSGFNHKIMIKV